MNILALDLGSKTGYAICHDGAIESGTRDFKGKRHSNVGYRFLAFERWLNETIEQYNITVIYYEEVRKHYGTAAAHMYGGYQAILWSCCEKSDTAYKSIPVATIKKHITGKGNANKEEVRAAIFHNKGFNAIDDNEADALGVLFTAMEGL